MTSFEDAAAWTGRSIVINMRADNYQVALTAGTCGSCGSPTRLIGLMLPPGHEILADDEMEDPNGASRPSSWERSSCATQLFYLLELPAPALRHFSQIAPAYRLAGGGETDFPYWANHCEQCNSRFDDQDLFCEFEGVFVPTVPAAASKIDLLRIFEPIAVAAAASAYDPPFLSYMREF